MAPRTPPAAAGWVFALAIAGFAGLACVPPAARLPSARTPGDARAQASLQPDEMLAHRLSGWCRDGEMPACADLGQLYLEGRGVPPLVWHAVSLFEYACQHGEHSACLDLADLYEDGIEGEPDLARALSYREQACKRGFAQACTGVGLQHRSGFGTPAKPRKAARWFRRGCGGGDPAGCHELGVAYLGGHGVLQDAELGLELLDTACTGDHAPACVQLAALYEHGDLIEPDAHKSDAYRDAACTAGDGGVCTLLGWQAQDAGQMRAAARYFGIGCGHDEPQSCAMAARAFELGLGGSVQPRRAFTLYRAACMGGVGEACGRAMVMAPAPPVDGKGLRALYEKACGTGDLSGCHYLAGVLADGVGGPASESEALELYASTCGPGAADSCLRFPFMADAHEAEPLEWLAALCDFDGESCTVLGEVHQSDFWGDQSPVIAAKFFQRGCAADNGQGCYRLAALYANGDGVERDEEAAARLHSVACDAGVGSACDALAEAHQGGVGVAVDPALAKHYRDLACGLGVAGACGTGVVLPSPLPGATE